MEWSQLKSIEAGWEPSLAAQNLLVERIYQREIAPKTFYFPILKPLLAVAAIAVLLFGLLLLWPKNPIEEQVVTLPGSSSAAKPDEYVENKEEIHQQEIIDNPAKEEAESGQQGGLPFNEALAIVKKKATSRNFDEALTEEQRKAFSAYLAHENYYYLQGQLEGEIGRLKESGAKTYTLEMQVFTTKEYLGKNLFHDLPFGTLVEQSAVIAPDQQENPYFYPRILGKELDASANYLENLTVESALPDGRAAATLSLGEKPLTKKQCETLINRFLAIKGVTWVEFQYQVEDESGNPTAIHKYWETQKELPFEQAKAIVSEKVQKRPNQQLSDKERMAFYKILSCWVEKTYKVHSEKAALSFPHIDLHFCTTAEGDGMNFIQDFPLKMLESGKDSISNYYRTERIGTASLAMSYTVPEKESVNDLNFESLLGKFAWSARIQFHEQNISVPSEDQMKDWIRQLLGYKCASGIQLDDSDIAYGRTDVN